MFVIFDQTAKKSVREIHRILLKELLHHAESKQLFSLLIPTGFDKFFSAATELCLIHAGPKYLRKKSLVQIGFPLPQNIGHLKIKTSLWVQLLTLVELEAFGDGLAVITVQVKRGQGAGKAFAFAQKICLEGILDNFVQGNQGDTFASPLPVEVLALGGGNPQKNPVTGLGCFWICSLKIPTSPLLYKFIHFGCTRLGFCLVE